jgi:hypothetical protein
MFFVEEKLLEVHPLYISDHIRTLGKQKIKKEAEPEFEVLSEIANRSTTKWKLLIWSGSLLRGYACKSRFG